MRLDLESRTDTLTADEAVAKQLLAALNYAALAGLLQL